MLLIVGYEERAGDLSPMNLDPELISLTSENLRQRKEGREISKNLLSTISSSISIEDVMWDIQLDLLFTEFQDLLLLLLLLDLLLENIFC